MDNFFVDAAENLRASIKMNVESGRLTPLLLCMTAAKVSSDDFQKIFVDSSGDADDVANKLFDAIDSRLCRNEFESLVDASNKFLLLKEFALGKRAYFCNIDRLLSNFDENSEIIKKYSRVLSSKKTQSIRKDKWGDVDESGWKMILREFSGEMLVGDEFESIFDKFSKEVRLYFEAKNALDLFPRFVWVVYELYKGDIFPVKEMVSSSSKEIGVEFEREIKSKIESVNSRAVVEETPASGDQGADLIVYIGPLKIVIQAKKYTGNVGNSAVQEIYAAKNYMNAHAAIVVTNAEYTKSAKELAAELEVILLYEHQVSEFFSRI